MRSIRNLEIHVTHSCNFSCESCAHYSNQGHGGIVSLDEAAQWMEAWHRRVQPRTFGLVGGEPTIHPRLPEFVTLARRYWPDAHARIVTNGWFLHRHPTLPAVLRNDPNASICLSVHHDSPAYREQLQPVLGLLRDWVQTYGIRVACRTSYERWTRRYLGTGAGIEPYADGQPRLSWENCPAKHAAQLFEGKIWKCAPLAYLKLQDAKYHLSDQWRPYLQYQPLAPDCAEDELNEFFNREDEVYCGMCPARPERFKLPMPVEVGPKRVAAASPPGPSSRPVVRSGIHPLSLPSVPDPQQAWQRYPLFRGPTRQVSHLSCHASVLRPGATPHAPHEHDDEEILIVLAGEADLIIVDGGPSAAATTHRLRPGGFVYYPARQRHTIHNPGPEHLKYLMFKWRSGQSGGVPSLGACAVTYPRKLAAAGKRGFRTCRVLQGATQHLEKLHCHVTTLEPGHGYRPHVDAHDVALLVLEGTLRTLGRRVTPWSVVYCAAGTPHGMTNVGDVPAVYLVLEFHGRSQARTGATAASQSAPERELSRVDEIEHAPDIAAARSH